MLLSVFLLFSLVWSQSRASTSAALECRIYSKTYGEYLYAKYKFLGLGTQRKVSLTSGERENSDFTAVFTYNDPSGIWYLEPVDDTKDTFTLRNKKYHNEFLRGSESFQDMFFKKNRDVFAEKMDWLDVDSFMWRFERVNPNERTNLFHITNVKWDLPLNAKEYFSSINSRKLRLEKLVLVSLSTEKSVPKSEWMLKCHN